MRIIITSAEKQKYERIQKLLKSQRQNNKIPFTFYKIDFKNRELEFKANRKALRLLRGE